MKILPFAIRNIGRNRQRTMVTVAAMGLAGFIMVFYASLLNGFSQKGGRRMLKREINRTVPFIALSESEDILSDSEHL